MVNLRFYDIGKRNSENKLLDYFRVIQSKVINVLQKYTYVTN